jgi:glycine cleavage system transcriptional repressor
MERLLATVVGLDRTGIVHSVSSVLLGHGCVLSEVSQTTLLGQFAGLFSFTAPEGLDSGGLAADLNSALAGLGLSAWITPIGAVPAPAADAEPYVLTLTGAGSPGLIPTVTGALASFDANIDNLRSVSLSPPEGDAPGYAGASGEAGARAAGPAVLVLELTVPAAVSQKAFRQSLALAAEELGIEVSLQHRDIFEAIHRL